MPAPWHGRELAVYYDQEVTEGTTDSAAPFLSLSQHSEVSITFAIAQVAVTKSGDVDKAAVKKGWSYPVIRITCNPNTTNGKAFIKNFSSTDNSFTLVVKDGGTGAGTIFWRIPGCKVKRITPRASIYNTATALEVDIEIWGWQLLFTESGGSPTYEAVPNTFVNWSDCAVRIGGSLITNWYDFTWTLENDLEPLPDNTGAITTIKRGIRTSINGAITRSVQSTQSTEFNAASAATDTDVRFDLVSDQYLFDNGAYEEVAVVHPISGVSSLRTSFVGGQYSTV